MNNFKKIRQLHKIDRKKNIIGRTILLYITLFVVLFSNTKQKKNIQFILLLQISINLLILLYFPPPNL